MQVLGIRFCSVSAEAEDVAGFLGAGLGLPERKMTEDGAPFSGAIFPAGESWIEVWPEGPGMPAGIMLQIVVDDADVWAGNARKNGLEPTGPIDSHGERIYYLNENSVVLSYLLLVTIWFISHYRSLGFLDSL